MRKFAIGGIAAALLVPMLAFGQTVTAAKGQSPEQQQKDEAECYSMAVQQSGYDPANPPPQAQTAPVTGSGGRARGAVAGAAVGAIGGNDVGNAAAKGAVVGGVAQRNRNRGAAAQANQQQQSAATAFQNARAGCLQGRGYTLK